MRGWKGLRMKTLVVANRKGGVGKSLIATHAAWWFAEKNKTVLVVDLDTQGNTSRTLSEANQLGDAVNLFDQEPFILPDIERGAINLLKASEPLDSLKAKGSVVISPFINTMRGMAEKFDVCVIDTSPDQNHVNISALISASHAIAPLNLGDYAIDGVRLILQTIIGIKRKYNHELEFIGLLPNMFIRNQPTQVTALDGLKSTYPEKYIFPLAIGHRSSFETTVRERRPIWTSKKTAAREANSEMRAVLSEIEKRMEMS